MSWSRRNPAWNNLRKGSHDRRIQDEASLANSIQESAPELSRSEALSEATRILDNQ